MKLKNLFEQGSVSASIDNSPMYDWAVDVLTDQGSGKHLQDGSTKIIVKNNELIIKNSYLEILDKHLTSFHELPFKIKSVGYITVKSKLFSSFKNFADILDTDCDYYGSRNDLKFSSPTAVPPKHEDLNNTNLLSLEGITPKFECVDFTGCPKLSFSGVNKHIKSVDEWLRIDERYVGPLLGLLLINNFKHFEFSNWLNINKERNDQINKIIDSHLKGDRDIIDCKEELMTTGFKEYAKL